MTAATDRGFTLIEALVAMAVLAVAAGGLIRASEGHIDTVARLEARTAADLVAANRAAEIGLPGAGAALPTTVTMLDRRWHVAEAVSASADPDLAASTITVESAAGTGGGTGGRTTLRVFRDRADGP